MLVFAAFLAGVAAFYSIRFFPLASAVAGLFFFAASSLYQPTGQGARVLVLLIAACTAGFSMAAYMSPPKADPILH
ncbi:MAG TPA: hypothetical protein VK445_05870 [Dissulfurispiraceae bacterium]|nr:hypothetical protein [Dissulfurispiraceae bacterium]